MALEENESIRQQLAFLGSELSDEIFECASIQKFPKGTEILREEQYVKVIPFVLKGVVKVYSKFKDRELLLYYIEASQSCVTSFSSSLKNKPSKVFASTEEDSEILLIPVEKIPLWLKKYPLFSNLFYEQYDLRYADLLDTIQQLLMDKMDKRLYDYLVQKTKISKLKNIKISHSKIAHELGTVREVITRTLKKLEIDNKIINQKNGIKVL